MSIDKMIGKTFYAWLHSTDHYQDTECIYTENSTNGDHTFTRRDITKL